MPLVLDKLIGPRYHVSSALSSDEAPLSHIPLTPRREAESPEELSIILLTPANLGELVQEDHTLI